MDNSQVLKDCHQMKVEFSSLMSDDSTKEKKLNEKGKLPKGSTEGTNIWQVKRREGIATEADMVGSLHAYVG